VSEGDFRALARSRTREQFIAAFPHPFLLGIPQLTRPMARGRTVLVTPIDVRDGLLMPRPRRQSGDAKILVLPVKKVQPSFPSMITVGRTQNNDLVIEDGEISKFHAFFRVSPSGVELADAGSRNGTFVQQRRLEPKGPSAPVMVGDAIQFGSLEFVFLDAGGVWERLR
jgi:hypothetical protein